MSVIARYRTESQFEPIVKASDLESELILLMFKNFGLKDIYKFINKKYNNGEVDTPDPSKYIIMMADLKRDTRRAIDSVLINLRTANRIRVASYEEYIRRLEHQNKALFALENIIVNLHKIVEVFNVDINYFRNVIKLLYLEQQLINKWIERDSEIYGLRSS